jgi:MraZ protein
MFRGQHEHTMDAKGRVSFPARFREVMAGQVGERLVLTRGLGDAEHPFLDAYPAHQWEQFERRVLALPRFDPNVVRLQRVYVSAAVECELDSLGRVLVPPALREHARLSKAVVWAGMIDRAELWSAQLWEEVQKAASGDLSFLKALWEQLKL